MRLASGTRIGFILGLLLLSAAETDQGGMPNDYLRHSQTENFDPNRPQNVSKTAASVPRKQSAAQQPAPSACYEEEKPGECAARIVQEAVAEFSKWQTIAAVGSAIAAILTAIFLVVQLWLTRRQVTASVDAAGAAATQARVAEQTISVLESPHLFTICSHNFIDALFYYELYDNPSSPNGFREIPTVKFRLKNYGKSPAILTQIAASLFSDSRMPEDRIKLRLPLPEETTIAPNNETPPITVEWSNPAERVTQHDFRGMLNGDYYFWFAGYVVFEDVLGFEHTVHFCWTYSHGVRAFEPVPRNRNYTERRRIDRPQPAIQPSTAWYQIRGSAK